MPGCERQNLALATLSRIEIYQKDFRELQKISKKTGDLDLGNGQELSA